MDVRVISGGDAESDSVSGSRQSCLVYAVVLLVLGLVYRGQFLSEGFVALDEGWLQSLGQRVVKGQLPYRDFNYLFPPLSVFKEASLIALLGDAYGILTARWLFSFEVAMSSVLAFIVLTRFVRPKIAFLATLPTTFFAVIGFYFANYNYDGEFFLLCSILVLVHDTNRLQVARFFAGAAIGMAFLCKPTFLLFLPLPVIADVMKGRPLRRLAGEWLSFFLGFAFVAAGALGYFIAVGSGSQFLYQSFRLATQANPRPAVEFIWQDLPGYFTSSGHRAALVVAGVTTLAAIALRRPGLRLGAARGNSSAAAAGALACGVGLFAAASSLRSAHSGDRGNFLALALCLLLALNALALLFALLARRYPSSQDAAGIRPPLLLPPEVPLFALGLQYAAQYTNSGSTIFYAGTFLSLPVALIFVYQVLAWRLSSSRAAIRSFVPRIVPAAAGLWLAVGAIALVDSTTYFDGDRSQLTRSFRSAKLSGVRSRPANVEGIEALIDVVKDTTKPDDPILVFPEMPALYFLTDRSNPTRQDWYDPNQLTSRISQQSISDMEQRPPRLVLIQRYWVTDLEHVQPINYEAIDTLRPIHHYLLERYQQVGTVADVDVFMPPDDPGGSR